MSIAITQAAPSAVVEFKAEHTLESRNRLALEDLEEGFRLWRLAWKLGWLDIRLRYRGSVLGPFWMTLSTAVMVAALGYLYAGIFHTSLREYVPYLALSLVLWTVLSTTVAEACSTFTDAEHVIRSVRMPFSVFALRTVLRNGFVLAHNVSVILVIYLVFRFWPGWHAVLLVPGAALWIIDAISLVVLLGAFCARFRDILPIVNSIMQIAFFVTPVIWKPQQLGDAAFLLPINPFYDVVEIVRGPLLGEAPTPETWIAAVGYSGLLLAVAWFFFAHARARIAFWM